MARAWPVLSSVLSPRGVEGDVLCQDCVQLDRKGWLVAKYPDDLMWTVSSDDIQASLSSAKINSLIGVESGHAEGVRWDQSVRTQGGALW